MRGAFLVFSAGGLLQKADVNAVKVAKKTVVGPHAFLQQAQEAGTGANTGILGKMVVQPYGVLGAQLKGGKKVKRAEPPSKNDAIFDPAGLQYIRNNNPGGAGGASGEIYDYIGIGKSARESQQKFARGVPRDITKAGMASLVTMYDKTNVVHVVGPDFRNLEELKAGPPAEQLANAYHSALEQIARALIKLPPQYTFTTLRMLPVSAGVFAGSLSNYMENLTAKAIEMGFDRLEDDQKKILLAPGLRVELCIFEEPQFDKYKQAVDNWLTGVPVEIPDSAGNTYKDTRRGGAAGAGGAGAGGKDPNKKPDEEKSSTSC